MIKILKKLFCKHKNSEVVCWHIVRDYNGTWLEIQYKCNECGKYYFRYIKGSNKDEFNDFISRYIDKEWSNTCKPVL